jgi:hypothetical protein
MPIPENYGIVNGFTYETQLITREQFDNDFQRQEVGGDAGQFHIPVGEGPGLPPRTDIVYRVNQSLLAVFYSVPGTRVIRFLDSVTRAELHSFSLDYRIDRFCAIFAGNRMIFCSNDGTLIYHGPCQDGFNYVSY